MHKGHFVRWERLPKQSRNRQVCKRRLKSAAGGARKVRHLPDEGTVSGLRGQVREVRREVERAYPTGGPIYAGVERDEKLGV